MKRLIESSNVYMRDSGWLLAELQVKYEDVCFVQAGQLVSIKVAAYPFQKYGLIEGRIQTLTPDAQAPDSQNPNTLQGYKAILACVFRKSQTIDPEFVTSLLEMTSTLWWKLTKASDRNRSLMNDS